MRRFLAQPFEEQARFGLMLLRLALPPPKQDKQRK
jgi:hypothetical protein